MDNFENVGEVFFWVPVSVLALAVLGLLWAPFAALICLLVARFRKLEGEAYGTAGAGHSTLLVLPWIYLLFKMLFGRSLPVFVIAPAFIIIYGIWVVFYVLIFNVGALVASAVDMLVTHTLPLGDAVCFFIVLSVILPVNIYTLRVSLINLRHRYAADKERLDLSETIVPVWDYLAPFAWLIVWSIIVLIITVAAGLYAYTLM